MNSAAVTKPARMPTVPSSDTNTSSSNMKLIEYVTKTA